MIVSNILHERLDQAIETVREQLENNHDAIFTAELRGRIKAFRFVKDKIVPEIEAGQ